MAKKSVWREIDLRGLFARVDCRKCKGEGYVEDNDDELVYCDCLIEKSALLPTAQPTSNTWYDDNTIIEDLDRRAVR